MCVYKLLNYTHIIIFIYVKHILLYICFGFIWGMMAFLVFRPVYRCIRS